MSAKSIWIIVLIVALIYVAGQPLGQMIAAIGGGLVTIGNDIAAIGVKFHG
jgi:hypothetical protein